MIWMRRGLFAGSLAIGLGIGCSSEVQDTSSGGAGGTSTGGTSAGGTGAIPACWPTDPVCYSTSAGFSSPGHECLAMRDNSTQDRVQMRQTWFKSIAPKGNTIDIIYQTLKNRSELPSLTQCNMSTGTGGYIQLTDWDRTNKTDITQQTIRNGYASFVGTTTADAQNAINNGLCFADVTYLGGEASAPPDMPALPTDGSLGMSLPFHATPTLAKRVAQPFTMDQARTMGLTPGQGIAYVDEANHSIHGYAPLAWVVIWDSATSFIVIPAHDGETNNRFNDGNFNCVGRYRAEVMSTSSSPPCDSTDQNNPPWGCLNDGTADATGATCPAGSGPSTIKAYFLITELEQVFSTVLNSTLCVSYQTFEQATTDGWAKDVASGGWGNNCRGATYTDASGTHLRWNPASPNGPDGIAKTADDGIPYGDWCSKTNSASTDSCHDAYLSQSTGTGAAIKVKDGTCTQ